MSLGIFFFVQRLAELEESPYATELLTPCFVVWVSRYIKNYFQWLLHGKHVGKHYAVIPQQNIPLKVLDLV
jgi:hypothetical protein